MNAGIQNLVISLGVIQGIGFFVPRGNYYLQHYQNSSTVARKIPFDDPQVLNCVRIAYVSAQVIILGIYYTVSMKVSIFMSH
jgi:hypothetical protein